LLLAKSNIHTTDSDPFIDETDIYQKNYLLLVFLEILTFATFWRLAQITAPLLFPYLY
jgi:hypothetical protein